MPLALNKFITDNFSIIFGICATWSFFFMACGLWKRRKRGLFPDGPENVAYEEKYASGRSLKNWYSKLGGARNCLRLVITDKELWITPIFPFSALSEMYDLDHRILLSSVKNVSTVSGLFTKSVLISYNDSVGANHQVEVTPKHFDNFVSCLNRGVAVKTH